MLPACNAKTTLVTCHFISFNASRTTLFEIYWKYIVTSGRILQWRCLLDVKNVKQPETKWWELSSAGCERSVLWLSKEWNGFRSSPTRLAVLIILPNYNILWQIRSNLLTFSIHIAYVTKDKETENCLQEYCNTNTARLCQNRIIPYVMHNYLHSQLLETNSSGVGVVVVQRSYCLSNHPSD